MTGKYCSRSHELFNGNLNVIHGLLPHELLVEGGIKHTKQYKLLPFLVVAHHD